MIIRQGFVSNSSSGSFLQSGMVNKEFIGKEQRRPIKIKKCTHEHAIRGVCQNPQCKKIIEHYDK